MPKAESQPFIVNHAQILALLGISKPTLHDWCAQGMPKAGRGEYDAAACVAWLRERHQIALAEARDGADAKTQLTQAQVERTRLEVSQMRGELLDATDFQRVLNAAATVIASQLDGLGPRIAGEVVGMTDVATIQAVVFREARGIRSSIADALASFADEVEGQAA